MGCFSWHGHLAHASQGHLGPAFFFLFRFYCIQEQDLPTGRQVFLGRMGKMPMPHRTPPYGGHELLPVGGYHTALAAGDA